MQIYLTVHIFNTDEGCGNIIQCYETLEDALRHYEFLMSMCKDDDKRDPFVDGKITERKLWLSDGIYPRWSLTNDQFYEIIEIQRKTLREPRYKETL